jgi:serine/threonine protein kinase
LRIEQHGRGRRPRTRKAGGDRSEEQRRMVGRIIDEKYRIIGAVGEGGMSSIYEAEHLGLDRRVAIKVLHPSLSDDPEAIARLRHEAKVVSAIGHPNICEVFDLGRTADGSPYLVMELLMGESLADRIKGSGAMHFGELAPLVKQVLRALDAAHDKGILHRDLKPENVFIEDGRHGSPPIAKLLDFGISKSMSYDFIESQRLTHTGMVMGTPYYMAPEQARGDSGLDQRVDLWAIGVMMYEALAGRRPFVATNYNALLVKILTSRPRPVQKIDPLIPNGAAAIIERALSKLREDRFQTAREMIDAISRVERIVAAEDPHAPTMMMRRPAKRDPEQTMPDVQVPARKWLDTIDDPPAFVDDEQLYDAAAAPHGQTWDEDHIPEPVEPTIQDRVIDHAWEDSDAWEHEQRVTVPGDHPSDTDVIARRDLHGPSSEAPHSSGADSMRDTEVIHRQKMLQEARRHEIEIRDAPSDVLRDDEDTLPTKGTRSEPPPPPNRAMRLAPRPPPPRPRSKPPPPRPGPPPSDDDEKTTLYDIEAAKAKLAARKKPQADPEQR